MISIIIPHKHTPDNDAALELALRSIRDKSRYKDHEVIVDDSPICPYAVWNAKAEAAHHSILCFTNSDVIFAQDWDVNFVRYCERKVYLSGWLVECGVIPVNQKNIEHDFGRKPADFQEVEFERFVANHKVGVPDILFEEGWYMPCVINRSDFLEVGGFPTASGRFPEPLDHRFILKLKTLPGWRWSKANSWAYHFQNLSGRPR